MMHGSLPSGITPVVSQEQHVELERRARRFWVSIVVGLLGTQILIGGLSVYLSQSDPTVVVAPNYYNAAVNWDATRRARQGMELLGWQLEITSSPPAENRRQLSVRLLDRDKQPVTGYRVTGNFFHHARASDVDAVRFTEMEPGVYVANSRILNAGLWQSDLRIEGEAGIFADNRELAVR